MERVFFKWGKDFNTGNNIIDQQHFKIVEIINGLFQFAVNNEKIEEYEIVEIRELLSSYVVEHFETEEAMMNDYSIDIRHVNDHKMQHLEFRNEVMDFFKDISTLENPKKLNELLEFLIRWLAYHILNTDKSLIRQINYIIDKDKTPSEAFNLEDEDIDSSTEPLLKALKVLYQLVSKKNREILKKNNELEKKVRLRTAELEKANKQLNDMLLKDVLTGLPNRRFVINELKRLSQEWERYTTKFSILFIDVDKFKQVNDQYGHEKGDDVLKWISEFLLANIRRTDIACRLGGDEFLIICSHTDSKGAAKLGKKLIDGCRNYEGEMTKYWKPSLSIGVSTVKEGLSDINDLLKNADSAMYVSKKNGGGRLSIHKENSITK